MFELTPESVQALLTLGATAALAALLYAVRRFYVHYAAQSQADIVARLVRAAEQMLSAAAGEDKLDWVIEQVSYLFPKLKIDETLLRVLIEAEVQQMKTEQQRSAPVEKGAPLESVGELKEAERVFVVNAADSV